MPDGTPANGRPSADDPPAEAANELPAADQAAVGRPAAGRWSIGAADLAHGDQTDAGRSTDGGRADGGRADGGRADSGRADSGSTDGGLTGGELSDEPVRGETTAPGDRAGFRLAAFGAVLVVVLFAGYGLGRLNNSTASASAPTVAGGASMPGMVVDESQPHSHSGAAATTPAQAAMPMGAAVGGLSLSSGGLTLVPVRTDFAAGQRQRLSFRVAGAGGVPVTTFAVVHDKLLHLVIVRRDLSGFQHIHPSMAADGTWSVALMLAEPGSYRMVADFTAVVGGQQVATTLGADLTVAGNYAPRALPAPVQSVATDGFPVSYEGKLSTQSAQPVLVSVAGGALEPYLGAFGHLVVLRQGDLAYVHVHPEPQLVDGKVKFWLAMPSAGTYRMFFDFQVAGRVHTAAWTATIS